MRQSIPGKNLSRQFRRAVRSEVSSAARTRLMVEQLEDRRVLAASILPDTGVTDSEPADLVQSSSVGTDVGVPSQEAGGAAAGLQSSGNSDGPRRSAPQPIGVGSDATLWVEGDQSEVVRTAIPGELVIGVEAGQDLLGLIEHTRESSLQAPVIMGPLVTDAILSLEQSQLDVIHLRFSGSDQLDDIVAFATEIPGVAWAQPNYQYTGDIMDFIPNDPLFAQQYHHDLMGNTQAWDITLGDPSVVVAVTDTGVQVDHPDLAANMWTNDLEANGLFGVDDDNNGFVDDIFGYDFVADDGDPSPLVAGDDHGTHVAGIVAGVTNNETQVAGTAGGASVMALRISGSDGGFTSTIMANSFAYAIDNGARIANTSFNINRFVGDSTFTSGLQYYYDGGGLHFNSAGNANELNPARQAFEQTLLVASTDANDVRSGFSNYGTGIDVAAPGSSILSTETNSGTGFKSGTSMAAPNAAGAAALIWSANPDYTRDQVAAQLLGTADNIDAQNPGFVGLLGSGRVNSFAALTQTLAAPQVESQSGLPVDGSVLQQSEPLGDFTLQFDQIMDPAAVNDPASYELRYAGANGVFDDADDIVYPVTPTSTYMMGSNSTSYTFGSGPFEIGQYRFSLLAEQLVNPFDTPLDGNGDDVGGDNYTVSFEIAMNPFEQIGAPGTLLYGTEITAQVATAAEVDSYSFDFSANQMLSVAVVPTDEGLQPAVEVVGPTGAVLASSTASSAGLAASVSGQAIFEEGSYTVRVSGAGDTVGGYELAVSLNGELESESVDGISNDTFATAQSLESSFMPLSPTASRGAVIGNDSNVGPSQTLTGVFAPRVLNYSLTDLPIPTGDGFVTVTAFADLDLSTEFLTLGIENMADRDIFVDDGAQSQEVVANVALTLAEINAIIADDQADFSLTPSPLVAQLDGGSWATVQLSYPVADDFYSFSLGGGQSATIVVTGDGNPDVQLFDSTETLVAAGRSSAALDQVINNFTAPVDAGAADYVIKVAGEGDYSVTVTRGADFDTETNNTFETAQDPTAALGFIDATADAVTSVKTDFPAIDSLDSFCGCEPPDTHAAAGPDHIVEVVNTSIAVFDKSGNVLAAPQAFTTFFDSSIVAGDTFTFDPVVAYMEDIDRWAVAILSGATASAAETDLLLAVSDSSDPTAGWTEQHRIDFGGISPGLFADYPKIGWNADALVLTLNMFGNSFEDVNIVTVDKASVMDNDRSTFTSFLSERPSQNFTMAAATMHGSVPGDPMWFVGQTAFGGTQSTVRLTRMDNPLSANPAFSTFLVPVDTYVGGSLPNAPQPGGTRQTNDSRMLNAEMRDGRLVAAHTINVGGVAKATWYEFDVSNPNAPGFTQQATIDPDLTTATYFPSVAINAAGDIGLTYMQSSATEFTSMYVVGQAAGSLPGSMAPPQLVKAGNQLFPGSRSGDYSGITVDPVTDTFWAANEVSLSGSPDPRWSTHIAEFSVAAILDTDFYSFSANAGDALVIETDLPITGANIPANAFDPTITLFAPDGTELASDDDSLDGRNATLSHTAQQTGQYRVAVTAQVPERGEYFVDIQGATGVNPAPEIDSLSPFDGQGLIAFPTTVRIDFSEALLLPSVSAADVTIGGLPATGMRFVDGDSFEFDIDPAANIGDGDYSIAIAAGAVTDLQGQSLAEDFTSSFTLDTTGPTILSTTWNGQAFPADSILLDGPLTIDAIFSESLFTVRSARTGLKTPGVGDVVLTNTTTGDSVNPDNVLFDPVTLKFTAGFNQVEPGLYSVAFVSGDGAFEDALGNDLDGEPIGPGSDGTPSGDNTKGGDYTVAFEVDFVTTESNDFGGIVPAGSMIASSLGNVTRLHDATDADGFTFYANAGETISAIAEAQNPAAVASIELVGLSAPITSSPGGVAVMSPVVIPADGFYEMRLSADRTTDADVQLYRNAAVELFVGDSSAANPLDISDSFSAVGPGRYAALARTAPGAGDDVDEFIVDFTGKSGVQYDIILSGLTADYSGELLEIIAPDGTLVDTGSPDPLSSGAAVTNFDQGILGFTVAEEGVYTIRLTSNNTAGQYSIVVTDGHAFEVESNNNPSPTLRSLDGLSGGVGAVSPGIETFGEFRDPLLFSQAVPSGLTLETFDNTPVPDFQVGLCGFTIDAASNDACYSPGAIQPGITVTAPGAAQNELVVLGTGFIGNLSPVVGAAAFANSTRVDFNPPVSAFSLELWINALDLVGYTVLDPNGNTIATSNIFVFDGQPNFLGFTAEVPIGAVQFDSTNGDLVDNVRYGGALRDNDLWSATYTAGEYVQLSATALLDDPMHSPVNALDPEIRVVHPDGSTVVAQDSDSLDGKNAVVSFFAPVDGVYTIEVLGQTGRGEYLVGAPEDSIAPVVTDVVVASSTWTGAFVDIVDGGGAGAGNGLGVSLPGASQTRNLPWQDGIDRVYVTFSEDVSASWVAQNVSLNGTTAGNIPITLLEYGVAGDNVATIGIASGITNDRLVLSIADSVTDASKNRLDGEWTTDSSLVSGDGTQGGRFNFFFDVLAGDINNSDAVNLSGDVLGVFAQNGMLPANLEEAYFDFNSSAAVNVSGDVLGVFALNGSILPGPPPMAPGSLRGAGESGGASGGNGGMQPEGEGPDTFAQNADSLFASLGDDQLDIQF
ncbi:MAG: hypothetical protein Aurels2KO_05900 [Aureliella sp.]